MKKIFVKIRFEIGEDLSIVDKLISQGWKVQERTWHDADFGLKGTKLEWCYLEFYHKYDPTL